MILRFAKRVQVLKLLHEFKIMVLPKINPLISSLHFFFNWLLHYILFALSSLLLLLLLTDSDLTCLFVFFSHHLQRDRSNTLQPSICLSFSSTAVLSAVVKLDFGEEHLAND